MALDLSNVLTKVKGHQWALADINWEAPGAELISDEQWPKLKAFMADLVWIEQVGARGFAALATKAKDPTLVELYRWFHAEEQRHANAELALMHRWGMLAKGELPEPNVNVRLAIEWLDRFSDRQSMIVLGTVIPMLEVALDGALLKFLTDEIRDPVCLEVFDKINNDESRHLAVDFHVLEQLGHGPAYRKLIEEVAGSVRPSLLVGALMYVPLLSKVRDNIVDMGLDESRLYAALTKFGALGDRSAGTRRSLTYQIVKRHGVVVSDRSHPYHRFGDLMVTLTSRFPTQLLLRSHPSWVDQLTYEPAA